MTERRINAKGATLFARESGSGPTLVFSHGLGLDHHVWDGVIAHFPDHRCVAYDLRGHGASDVPDGPYSMGTLVADAEAVCETLSLKDVVFVGLSVGGFVAQGLAVKRLDLVRGMVLIASAAKVGQPGPWHDRAAKVRAGGMEEMRAETMNRWSLSGEQAERMGARFLDNTPEGYAATCEALAGTDFYTPTSGLRLPTMGLCGDRDKATPPDLVRETTDLIPGSSFHLIRGAGHISPQTHPAEVARHLHEFLTAIGHA